MIIDENQLSSADNILSTTKFKTSKQQNQLPPSPITIDQNGYCCKLAPISALGNTVKAVPL